LGDKRLMNQATTKVGWKMFIISKEAIHNVMSLKQKAADPGKRAECIVDVENMIKMKESQLARADWGACCGNIRNLVPQLNTELHMLQDILEVLRKGDSTKASPLLEDYLTFLQESYRPEPEHW
jgi:hypothetical protein